MENAAKNDRLFGDRPSTKTLFFFDGGYDDGFETHANAAGQVIDRSSIVKLLRMASEMALLSFDNVESFRSRAASSIQHLHQEARR